VWKSESFDPGHQLTLLQGGAQFFPALVTAVDAARQEVQLETYIFQFDGDGLAVARALERAAQRGVAVVVMMDGVGTPEVPTEWQRRWNAAGVRWHRYAPLGHLGLLLPGRWRRLHRKLCVVDRRLAFCGGINILDDLLDPHHGRLQVPRLDFSVRVEGPLVSRCRSVMAQFWARVQASRQLEAGQWRGARDQWPALGLFGMDDAQEQAVPASGSLAALVLRDNVRNRARIERAYLKAIGEARSQIVLANAYFLPGGRLRRALKHAVRRGVRVQVVVQGRYEYFMQYHASRPVFNELVNAGVELYEYTAGFCMPKWLWSMVCGQRWGLRIWTP